MIFFNLLIIKSFRISFGNISSICFNSSFLLVRSRDFKAPTCFSVCFSKAFPKGEYSNSACSIICHSLEGNISSPVRYSYSSILPHNTAIFAPSLLISYCNFSSLILSSIVMISFYIPSNRFFLKREGLSDARVASIAKKRIWFCSTFSVKINKILKVSI